MAEEIKIERARPYFDRRIKQMLQERSGWEAHWAELVEYLAPWRARLKTTETNKGGKVGQKVVDSTGQIALRTLVAGLMTGMTSPARPWFRLSHPDQKIMEQEGVRVWLESVGQLMREIFARSNLYQVLPHLYEELAVFGTSAMAVLEDYDSVIRVEGYTVGEYALAIGQHGRVNGFAREFEITVDQLVNDYGIESVSPNSRNQYQRGNLNQKVKVRHVIEPNRGTYPGLPKRRSPILSVHYESGWAEGWLRTSGFNEWPLMTPRWSALYGDIYGRGPGMEALPDVKALQVEQIAKATAIQKMASPTMVGPPSLRQTGSTTIPGGITYSEDPAGYRPAYEVDPRIQELMLDIREVQERIRTVFYADLFMMMANSDRRQITAREIQERHEEKLLMLGATYQRLQDELLKPLIDRTFSIMVRAGVLPDPPEQLRGVELEVEFVSILEDAQKRVHTGAVDQFLAFTLSAMQLSPEVADKVDADALVETYADYLGVTPKAIVDDKTVSGLRRTRAQGAQAQAAMAGAREMSGAAKDLAGADMEGNNALARMMGGQ